WRMADSSSMSHCTSMAAWRIAVPAGTLLLPMKIQTCVVPSHVMTSPCSQRCSVDRGETRELPAETLEEAGPPEEQRVAAEVKSDATVPPAVKDVVPEERLGRDALTELMVKRARQSLPYLGIELIDVRIKSINYVREVEQRVYERMISERRRIAARFRSEGDG